MKEGPVHDFPAVSESVDAGSTGSLIEARPGTTVIVDDTVYQWVGPDPYDRGEQIGTVTIVHWKSATGDRVPFTAHFEFDDGDTVSLTGVVPGKGTWKGKGVVAYGGGTGKFAGRTGQLDLESDNPKRWG
jgi:hypothetical protein